MFTSRSSFQEFVNVCEDRIVERDGLKRGECDGCNWARSQSYTTFGKFISVLPGLPLGNFPPGWAGWLVKNMRDQVSRSDYRVFIDRARINPMTAFQCFVRVQETTKDEDDRLKEAFEGKLPAAEKQLLDGVVTRRKAV